MIKITENAYNFPVDYKQDSSEKRGKVKWIEKTSNDWAGIGLSLMTFRDLKFYEMEWQQLVYIFPNFLQIISFYSANLYIFFYIVYTLKTGIFVLFTPVSLTNIGLKVLDAESDHPGFQRLFYIIPD